ncbi:hypothetical protein SAMN05421503_1383 [Terribacillus aidingensis]|uniref:Uncharacterized protein n=1 Tax=Terribacillus aidingensis TaxID=586416 RepID=A0A285NK24_9BACI|nr:hypothetical protein [Terribacillus aidingensis]SNZ09840.1 hypothetical protein SAMN05421503_1383 [Terribacillus aidingensis]
MKISDYINIILAIITLFSMIITFFTLRYAKRTLTATDAPRVGIFNYFESEKENGLNIGVHIVNYGRGIARKTFLLIVMKDTRKSFYLSKPVNNLKFEEQAEIEIPLRIDEDITNQHLKNFDRYKGSAVYVISQDYFGNIYSTKIAEEFKRRRLSSFDPPAKQYGRFYPRNIKIRRWMEKSFKSKMSYEARDARIEKRAFAEANSHLSQAELKKIIGEE